MYKTTHISVLVAITLITHFTTSVSLKKLFWENGDSNKYGNIQYVSDFFKCTDNSLRAESHSHPLIGLKIDQVIQFMGYPVEKLAVQTDDGYILTVFRIPFSPKSPLVKGVRKKPIYMNHGLSATGQEYILQWGDRNLGFLLADAGYDVFLANVRGTSYSPDHVDKNIGSRKYWDFSWHEIGVYDMPAVMKKIIEVTKEEKMYYLGHSMGTTTFMVALSEHPELNKHILMAFLMTPAGYVGHATTFMRHLAPLLDNEKYLIEQPFIGGKVETLEKLLEKLHLKIPLGNICSKIVADCLVCHNLYFMVGGYNGDRTNSSELPYMASVIPDLVSTKSIVHYGQTIGFRTFRQFDHGRMKNLEIYGVETPKDYNLSQITAPVVMMYSTKDELCVPQDVEYTASRFGKNSIKGMVLVQDYTHLDFATARDAREEVYDKILGFITENEKSTFLD